MHSLNSVTKYRFQFIPIVSRNPSYHYLNSKSPVLINLNLPTGVDLFWILIGSKRIKFSPANNLLLIESKLVWLVSGHISNPHTRNNNVSCKFISKSQSYRISRLFITQRLTSIDTSLHFNIYTQFINPRTKYV